jgi:hypothetical protein
MDFNLKRQPPSSVFSSEPSATLVVRGARVRRAADEENVTFSRTARQHPLLAGCCVLFSSI